MPTAAEAISQGIEARKSNDLSAARAHYADAAKLYRNENDPLAYAHAIRHIADMHCEESNFAEAKPFYEEAVELYRSSLHTKILDLANAVRPYASLSEAQGNLDLARQLFQEARTLYMSVRVDAGVAQCDIHLAKLQHS